MPPTARLVGPGFNSKVEFSLPRQLIYEYRIESENGGCFLRSYPDIGAYGLSKILERELRFRFRHGFRAFLPLPAVSSPLSSPLGPALLPPAVEVDLVLRNPEDAFLFERVEAIPGDTLDVGSGDAQLLSGFSDGASYALSLGLTNGDLFTHVLAFSPGFLAPAALQGRPRLYVSHGTEDGVLPINRCSRPIVANLREYGYDLRYEEFRGAHEVPSQIIEDAVRWLVGPDP